MGLLGSPIIYMSCLYELQGGKKTDFHLVEDQLLSQLLLTHIFPVLLYTGSDPPLTEWEYLPHIGPRPGKGFVGLKNAGATCYMNAVLQQLFMIAPVRDEVLCVGDAATFLHEIDEEAEKREKEREPIRKNKNEVCFYLSY